MRTSPEPGAAADADGAFGPAWRVERERVQERALPDGAVVVSCPSPYGVGGLGRHLDEVLEALTRRGRPGASLNATTRAHDAAGDGRAKMLLEAASIQAVRFSPAWRHWRGSVEFDRYAASRLPDAEHLVGFNGSSLAQLRAARRRGFRSLSLMAANSHLRRVIRQHELAARRYPLERPWATRLLGRNLAEYDLVDRIHVCSRYTRDSFLEEGFSEETLSFFPLIPDRRYEPDGNAPADVFEVVYAGSLTVNKGVPLLIDAFTRLPHADARLVLVGGWKTRGMRRFVEQARARDERITVSPGNVRERLRSAHLFVHATYEDGFAYAPAEALACGIPVLVSEDTGMKELLTAGVNGMVLPTGDLDALSEAIDAAYRGEAFRP